MKKKKMMMMKSIGIELVGVAVLLWTYIREIYGSNLGPGHRSS
jgi:nitrogen fixation-related uncharacterized protein